MKTGFIVTILLVILTFASAQTTAPKGGKTPFVHKNGEEVLINLQGENHNLWILNVFQPGDNVEEVRGQIEKEMTKSFPEVAYQYGEVSLNAGYEYQKLFETLDLVGEPKRGHTTPQVLVMKDGEGFIVYGPTIGTGVTKRLRDVIGEANKR